MLARRDGACPLRVRLGKPRVEQNESALPQIADMKATLREVCVGPVADFMRCSKPARLFDHLGGALRAALRRLELLRTTKKHARQLFRQDPDIETFYLAGSVVDHSIVLASFS